MSEHTEAVKIVQTYQQIVQSLSEPTISAHFSQTIQDNLKALLQTHLSDLVQNLQIDTQVNAQIANILPNLVQQEISTQIEPLAEKITERMHSVEQYQQKLAQLIQRISTQL